MIAARAVCAALLVACACGGGDDDAAAVDASTAADVPAIVWDGPDSLEVLVVDPGWYFGEDVPLSGARVLLDSPRGRLVARTGADGIARLEGFSFAEGAVDVSVIADGFPVRTLLHLDAWEEGRPLWVPVRPGPDARAADRSERFTVTLARSLADTEAYCWHDAVLAKPRHHVGIDQLRLGLVAAGVDERTIDVWPGLRSPGRIACLELAVAGDGSRTVRSFADARATERATLTFTGDATVTRTTARLVYPEPNPYGAATQLEAFVDDEDDDDFGVAVGVIEQPIPSAGADELTLAWVPSAVTGTATVRIAIEGSGAGWAVNNLPVEALSDPIPVRDPPTLHTEADGTLVIEGAEWGHDAGLFVRSSGTQAWLITVPRASGSFRLPRPPDGESWADVLPGGAFTIDAFLVVWSYDAPVARDHWGGERWGHHVTHSTYRPNVDLPIDL